MIQQSDKYVNDIKFNGSSINRIYLDGEVYWGNDPNNTPTPPPGPIGYDILEYVQDTQSSDSNAFSNTNHAYVTLTPFANNPLTRNTTFTIETELMHTGMYNKQYYGNGIFFGMQCSNSGITQGIGMFYNSIYNNHLRFTFLDNDYTPPEISRASIQDHRLTIRHTNDHIYLYDNTSDTILLNRSQPIGYASIVHPNNNFYLWGGGIESYNNVSIAPIGFRLYYFKLTVDDVLMYDLIPARRRSDSVIGLYNQITGSFYTSSCPYYDLIGPSI